jgi:hypothetical protein
MVPITEPLELVDVPPSGEPDRGGAVIPIRGRGAEAESRPARGPEPSEDTE